MMKSRLVGWLSKILRPGKRMPGRPVGDVQAVLSRLDRRLDDLEKQLAAARKSD